MILHSSIYISSSLQHKSSKILTKIQKKKKIDNLFCICIAYHPSNLLEIIKLNELYNRLYDNRSYIVVGVALEEEVNTLVKEIIEDVYKDQNNVDVRAYFGIEKKQLDVR